MIQLPIPDNSRRKIPYSRSRLAQTATEYLVITAVVIVIATLVLSTLGGIPSIGVGATESADIAQLSSKEIGLTSFSASIAKTQMSIRNNRNSLTQITSVTINGVPCWVPGPRPGADGIPRLMNPGEAYSFACNTAATASAQQAYSWNVSVNYTDMETNAQYTLSYGTIKGVSSSFSCPSGYIPVPGMTLMDGQVIGDFCVMKYEAKAWNLTSDSVDVDGYNGGSGTQWTGTALTNAQPRSEPLGQPWRNINWTDARAECQALGTNYDIISDPQWMVLAETIIRMPINNLNSSASEVRLPGGHNDATPNAPLATTSANDPLATGCNIWQSLDASANNYSGTCQVRGNGTGAEFGYNGTSNSFATGYIAGQAGRAQLRTSVLANGQIVWDLPGNILEWTSTTVPTYASAFSKCGYYTLATITECDATASFADAFLPFPWVQPSRQLSSASHAGYYYGNASTTYNGRFLRGSNWYLGDYAGVLNLLSSYGEPSNWGVALGFRCVVTP